MCCITGNFSLYTVSDSIFGALFSIILAWLWVLPALQLETVCRGLVLMLVECPGMGVGALLGVLARTCSMSIHLLNIDESRETKRVWNLSGMGVLRVCWQYRNLSLLQLSMSAGWSLDNCGKGGCVLKLVKDAILLAFYDILTQNLPSIMWNFAQPFYFSYWEFIRGIWLLSSIILQLHVLWSVTWN